MPAIATDAGEGSEYALTTPSMKYSNINMDAHCMVYKLPLSTPRNGNNSGNTFNTSHDPPGRKGASHSSHNRQRAIRPINEKEAP